MNRLASIASIVGILAGCGLGPRPAFADAVRVAIVPVGNPQVAVPLATRVADELVSAEGIQVVPQAEVFKALEVSIKTAPVSNAKPEIPMWPGEEVAEKELEQARDAYYDDRLADALDHLNKVEAQHDSDWVPATKRLELALWYAAVYLGLQDDASAHTQAERAVALRPEMEVNTRVFPPSVARLVDEIQKATPGSATILLQGIPEGASVLVDGLTAEGDRPTVAVGRHYVWVLAPGYAAAAQTVDVDGDVVAKFSLKSGSGGTQKSADLAKLAPFKSVVERGGTQRSSERKLKALSSKVSAPVIVLVLAQRVAGMERRAFVWTPKGGATSLSYPRTPDGENDVVAWTAKETERVAADAGTIAVDPTPSGGSTNIDANVVVAVRSRSLRSQADGGSEFVTQFVGVGPQVDIDTRLGPIAILVSGRYLSFAVSSVELELQDGSTGLANGGGLISARAGIGYPLSFGGVWILPSVAGRADVHFADDVVGPTGDPLGMLTSYRFIGFDFRLAAGVSVGSLRLSAFGGVAPTGSWVEDPQLVSGSEPRVSPTGDWGLRAAYATSTGWDIGVQYQGMTREVYLSGPASAPVSPQIVDAGIGESVHAFMLTAVRGF